MTDKELGQAVRRWRVARGWSRAEVAAKLSLGESTIAHIEASTRRPSWDVLQALLTLFDASIELIESVPLDPVEKLAAEERAIVLAWRAVDEDRRQLARRVLGVLPRVDGGQLVVVDSVIAGLEKSSPSAGGATGNVVATRRKREAAG